MEIKKYINDYKIKLDKELKEYFLPLHSDLTSLYDAMQYSVDAGGKRLRMIVLLESTKLFCKRINKAMPFACAAEIIHTYSLIHDDLPCMDNAEYRRGVKCCHKVYGEDIALLSGDALLNYAYEIMLAEALKHRRNIRKMVMAIDEIAKFSGINGMVFGQALDTQLKNMDYETLLSIYRTKTASMFIGPIKAGAYIGGADEYDVSQLGLFAEKMGIGFQIVDDVLDKTGDFDKLGKDIGKDEINKKTTILTFFSDIEAMELAKQYINEAKEVIKGYDSNGFFDGLCDYILDRDN